MIPEWLRRYHTCQDCGKTRHRSRMIRWGSGYVCANQRLCDERIEWNKRMAEYQAVSDEERRQHALAIRRAELEAITRALREGGDGAPGG